MTNAKVSIIIPAYNAEKFIERCIQSAIRQSLQEIEVIIVDDGSSDQTFQICNSFNDERIILLHQENAGPAAARNRGIGAASGDYIGFMDSDDFADSRMFETLYIIAKRENADIVNCVPIYINEKTTLDTKSREKVVKESKVTSYTDRDLHNLIKTANVNRILWFACKGIYRRSMIKKHNARFPEKIKLGEETPFVLECMLCSERIAMTKQELYFYVQRQGSLTKTNYRDEYFDMLNELYLEKKAVYQRYGFTDYESDLNQYTMEHTIPMIISNELSSGKKKNTQRSVFKEMRDTEMISNAFMQCDTKLINSKLRYLAILLKYKQYSLLSLLCK